MEGPKWSARQHRPVCQGGGAEETSVVGGGDEEERGEGLSGVREAYQDGNII